MFTTGTDDELAALDMTVEHCLFFENVGYLVVGVIELWDFTPANIQFNAVDMIRNHAYYCSVGYLSQVLAIQGLVQEGILTEESVTDDHH